jgi:hypothetical protein
MSAAVPGKSTVSVPGRGSAERTRRAHTTIERIAAERGTQIGEQRVGLEQNFGLRTCEEQRAHRSYAENTGLGIDPQGEGPVTSKLRISNVRCNWTPTPVRRQINAMCCTGKQ